MYIIITQNLLEDKVTLLARINLICVQNVRRNIQEAGQRTSLHQRIYLIRDRNLPTSYNDVVLSWK